MNCPFNNHDLVSFNGHIYSVSIAVWSPWQLCYTLGLVGFSFRSPLIWVSSDRVNKVSKKWKV